MKNIVLLLMISLMGISVQAQEKKNKNAKYDIEVNGNCDMCKKRIEKAALSVKGVKSAVWHIDHQDLHLVLDENKVSINQVHEAIAKVGHDTDKVKANDEVYNDLHGCCQYERKQ
ncbi:MAG: heavy-metal-associated domain-containing protein [Flavobacterium sp.]|jgi:mercuric ion binding protein|nr:heavy-metal-associated domain-containing protein [Flavobacterium sp.]